jgi:exosortase A
MHNVEMAESIRREVPCRHNLTAGAPRHSLLGTTIVVLGAFVIVLLVLFRETTWSMISMWQYSSYSHGYLVLPLSLWLIYVRRRRLAPLEVRPNPWALVLLAALGFAWFLGDLAAVQVIKQSALVGMLPTLVWLTLGTQITRKMLFPLLFLFFAVPAGEGLIPRLQDVTAFFAVKGLELVGVPVLLERRLISIPSGVWEVAEACSGLRYLTASLMLGCFYAYIVYRKTTRRIVFVAACIVVPIVANGLRAFGIILLGHLTQNRLAAGVDHLIYGGVFFGFVIFLLFTVGWRWREARPLAGRDLKPLSRTASWKKLQDVTTNPVSSWRHALWAALGVALVAMGPLSAHRLNDGPSAPTAVKLASPSVLPPWKPSDVGIGRWKPRSIEGSSELKQTYTSGPRKVSLYVAYYAGGPGGGGRKLVSSSNLISEGPHWAYVGERTTTATVDGEPITVHETALRSQEANLLVWSWYWIDGKFTDNAYRAKLLRLKTRLFGGPQASALVAVGAYYALDRSEATNTLQDFLRRTSLQAALKRSSN